uniref:Putative secreted protein n=1 Tax=Anopheles darlingi TaxID=43151 RepID=A0A2M4DEW2_ANODA
MPGVLSTRLRCLCLLASVLMPPARQTVSSVMRIQGCSSTAVALSRFGASFTSNPRIRSFASSLTSCHSLSGKLNRPSWIDSNSSS